MASTAVELAIILTAKDAASAGLQKVGQEMDKLGRAGEALKFGLGIATAGIGLGVTALIDFGKAAASEEVNIRKLAQAVTNTGGNWDELKGGIEATIAAMERTTAFSDTEMRDALSLLVAQTGDVGEAMKRLQVATDLSRGANIDLFTASKLLGKATDENANVLARYGIIVDKGTTATELLAKVQEKFSGQAVAFASTATGQWQIFGNQIENLKEDLGAALLPIAIKVFGTLIEFIDSIRNNPGLKLFADALGTAVEILGEMFSVITGQAPDAGAKLTEAVGPERAKEIMRALADVRETVKTVIDAVVDMVRWFQGSSEEASFLREVLGDLGAVFGFLASHAIPAVASQIRGFIGLVQTLFGWVVQVKDALGNLLGFVGNIVSQVQGLLSSIQIPSFQQGGIMPQTGLAIVHAGERILPTSGVPSGGISGGVTVIVQGSLIGLGKEELAQEIGRVFTQQRRLQGLA